VQPRIEGHLPDVVAVVERRDPLPMEREHRGDVLDHRAFRRLGDRLRITLPPLAPFRDRPACGKVAVHRIVR
jgi:hypothetical protein